MTREEALEFIAQSVKSDVDMALVADAIKALEQEPILDKLKAEIDLETRVQVKHYTNTDTVIDAVLEVTDNYKAETEEI